MKNKTKKMAITMKEQDEVRTETDKLDKLRQQVIAFEATTGEGKEAQKMAEEDLAARLQQMHIDFEKLRVRLEIETIEMLSGADIDFADPTPADALRNAS